MAHGGVAGHNLGTFLIRAFPLAFAFANSINGHYPAARNITNWLDANWDAYDVAMRKAGKSEEEMTEIYRHSLQFLALYLLAYYALDIHMKFLLINEGNAKDLTIIKESVGYAGLKCFQWSVNDNASLDELKTNLREIAEAEMGRLLQVKEVRRSR